MLDRHGFPLSEGVRRLFAPPKPVASKYRLHPYDDGWIRAEAAEFAIARRRPRAMLSDSNTSAAEISAADLERARRELLCPSQRTDTISYDWVRIGMGIVLAGGAYPIILWAIGAGAASTSTVWSVTVGNSDVSDLGNLIVAALMLLPIASLIGMVGMGWSMLVAALTLPVVYLVVWSLNLRASIIRVGAFAGGFVGFICILPFMLKLPWLDFGRHAWDSALIVLAGPVLATIVDQIGGASGGGMSREVGPAMDWQQYLVGTALWKPLATGPEDVQLVSRPRLQFGIRHLLWISVWLSLLLSLIRVCGIPYELILPLLMGWLLFQFLTLKVGGLLVQRLGPWWVRRRQFRST